MATISNKKIFLYFIIYEIISSIYQLFLNIYSYNISP